MTNIDSGWCYASVAGTGTVTVADGDASIVFSSSTDYTAIQNGDVIFLRMSDTYGYYPCFTILSGGGTANMEMETAFDGTAGAYNFYYSLSPRPFILTSYKRTLESPSDAIGLPNARWNNALAFDVEGVVMKISVEAYYISSLANCVSTQNMIDQNFDGDQMSRKPTWIWYNLEPMYGGYKAYPVQFTKVEYTMEPKNKSGTYYILRYRLECVARDPQQA